MLTFNDLLRSAEVDPGRVKLLRHETNVAGKSPYSLWQQGQQAFDTYQQAQARSRRGDFRSPIWASFVVTPSRETLFVGLYDATLLDIAPNDYTDPLTNEHRDQSDTDFYQTRPLQALSELAGRLVINWNAGARQWVQHAVGRDRPVIEIARAFEEPAFPGYAELILSLDEVPSLPAKWRAILEVSKGVYILTCPRTRELYVGSASGEGGFFARWSQYAKDGHGGNIQLKNRVPSNYQVGILQVAGSGDDEKSILEMEARWKRKFQSRDMGLNSN